MLSDLRSILLSRPLNYYINNYYEAISELKNQVSPLIGYFTNKTPLELLHALNLHPIRIYAFKHPKSQQGAYERYVQTFACSWLRDIIDNGLVNGYNELNGVIFSTGTCDSLQNVSDIWQKVFLHQLTYNLTFPIQSNEASYKYLENEFLQFCEYSKKNISSPINVELKESIQKFNRKREILRKIAELVSSGRMLYSTFARIMYYGDLLPVDEFIRIFKELTIPEYYEELLPKQERHPRLLVSGGMWDNLHLFDIPEWEGLVADDLSFGNRNFNYNLPESNSMHAYAKSQLGRVPEPTAYDDNQRLENLAKQIKDHNVEGVILLTMKFCDPDAFELIPIRKFLDSMDVPYLNLETSPDLSNLGQLQTRLAAFSELLI